MNIKPIRTQTDYEQALQRLDSLMDAQTGTLEFDELEILSLLVENYELKHYAINLPDPISAIKFRMDQENLQQKDLIPILGDRSIVSKVLNGQRGLTVNMIKNLHTKLNIPFENLFGTNCNYGI